MKTPSRVLPSLAAILTLAPFTVALAAPPTVPANVRAVILPAEVLLTWDATAGADHYRVYRADLDLRWMPIATNVTAPRYRDTDFRALPCYYQIAACNAAGECAATAEFVVNAATASISLIGANTRPLSDTSVALSWTILGEGGGDAMLEIGTSLNGLELIGANSALASRHDFSIVNLVPATTYFYRLTSAGANGAGFSYTERFTTRSYTPPPPAEVRLTDPFPMLATDEDTPVDFTLTADNPGGMPLTFFVAFVPFGTVFGTPPNLTYVSGPERTGLDFFDCGFTDGTFTFFNTVFVTVNFVLDPPIALDRSVTFAEDGGGKFLVQATAWDSNPLALDCIIVDGPTNGMLTKVPFEKMSLEYVPHPNFNGVDHFTFRSHDGQRTGNVATVRVRITPANDAPVAQGQVVTISSGTPQALTLNANDLDGDQLTYVVQAGPVHGTLSGPTPNLTGQLIYTPAAGFVGPDSFTWQVTDPSGAMATAIVSIDVVHVNTSPTANALSVSTSSGVPVNLTLTGSDLDGDALTFGVVTPPAHGTLSGTAPNLVYTPDAGYSGPDSFTFKANDGQADSAPATVSVTVASVSDTPSNLAGVAVSRSRVNLTWTDNSSRETGYEVECSNNEKKWKVIATLNANSTSYADLDAHGAKALYYRVRAVLGAGYSDYSNVASVTMR